MSVVEVKNISKKYKTKHVLKDISFYVNEGECVGIVGANGCGKTTLLGIISGSHKPGTGQITIAGENPLKNRKLFSDYVGYVPQENPLMEDLTVRDNLRFWYSDTDKKADEDIVNGTAAYLGLTKYYHTTVSKLSCGNKKRLSIACALAKNPKVLIMDEPGASLDIVGKHDVQSYLKEYIKKGGTVILTSHEETELKLCNRMYMLTDGILKPLDSNIRIEELFQMIRMENN